MNVFIHAFATNLSHTHTCTHTNPFYSSVDFVSDNVGELVPEGTFHHLVNFLVQNEDNTALTIQMDCHLMQTNWCPHLCYTHNFYARCTFWHNLLNLSWLGTV